MHNDYLAISTETFTKTRLLEQCGCKVLVWYGLCRLCLDSVTKHCIRTVLQVNVVFVKCSVEILQHSPCTKSYMVCSTLQSSVLVWYTPTFHVERKMSLSYLEIAYIQWLDKNNVISGISILDVSSGSVWAPVMPCRLRQQNIPSRLFTIHCLFYTHCLLRYTINYIDSLEASSLWACEALKRPGVSVVGCLIRLRVWGTTQELFRFSQGLFWRLSNLPGALQRESFFLTWNQGVAQQGRPPSVSFYAT